MATNLSAYFLKVSLMKPVTMVLVLLVKLRVQMAVLGNIFDGFKD